MSRANLQTLLEEFAKFGGDAAVVERQGYRREARTYAEVSAGARKWDLLLGDRGIGAGDRVVLWGVNSAEWVAAYWGVLSRGAVAVPMDASAAREFVEKTIRESGAKLILRDRSLPEPTTGSSLAFDDGAESPNAIADAKWKHAESLRNTIAEILFTSGTTAEPPGVVLTHGNFLANLEPIERAMQPYRKYERWLHPLKFVSLVPLSHVFGQFMGLFVPPLFGATVVFENSANPADILRTVKRERATVLIGVPRMLDLVRAQVEREIEKRGWRKWITGNYAQAEGQPFLRRAWRFRRIHRLLGFRFWAFISGGAALGSETEFFFKRLGYAVVQGYGMTETASLISVNHPFRATEGSVGKILPGREFQLAEDGEILVRGENVSAGYWENGELREAADGGWLRTGDLGELDAGGNLKFRGRKKNLIVTAAGLNVYPEDLEAALKKQADVRDAVVVAVEDGGNTEACAALLMRNEVKDTEEAEESRDATKRGAAQVVERANATLAEYQKVRRWIVWPERDFPRTPTGKPRLAAITASVRGILSRNGDATRSGGEGNGDPLEKLASTTALDSLSSLDRVELLSLLEQKYNIEINESEFSQAKTVADLRTLVEQPAARASEQKEAAADHFSYPGWTLREPARLVRLLVYYALVWPATQILGHPRVVGRENLRGVKGPVIVISNHVTRRADIGLILAALPARFRHRLATGMGGERLMLMRRPPREWFFAKRWAYQLGYWLVILLFNAFPLPRFSGFRASFRYAGEAADRGYSILVFPEGESNSSEDGRMTPFYPGIGLLAENLFLPIVPMRMDGVWGMKRERRRLARIGEITVRIGAPVTFEAGTKPEEIAKRLQSIVAEL